MDKNDTSFVELTETLKDRYNNIKVHDIIPNGDGSVSMLISGSAETLNQAVSKLGEGGVVRGRAVQDLPVIDSSEISKLRFFRKRETAATVTRDVLGESYLDLSVSPNIKSAKPQQLYQRAIDYYKTEDVYGSAVDLLTNFASKGFKNDIDDPTIKNFYDNWVVDTGFDKIVDQIFFEFFRSGFVRTYKVVGKYEPKVNYISPVAGEQVKKVNEDQAKVHLNKIEARRKERAAKKIKWSKDYIPIRYTILDPTLIEIAASSFLLDQQIIKLKAKALEDIKNILEVKTSDLTDYQNKILKSIPPELKSAAQKGEDVILDPYLVGSVDYRRQPYEVYAYPRGVRAFEPMEYKRALRSADYSTLDGITNFLLVVKVGNDNFPVKSQERLENVAELFNTPQKSFNVVWDHTLQVQRVEPTSVGDILGQGKFAQVNDDITGAFGVIRALIDGVGNPSTAAANLATKSIVEEIHYARKEVCRWIYAEYRDVAEAMAFERYPKIRFDNTILKDEILFMNVIQGFIDRRIISYKTGHEMLGFDFNTVLAELQRERDLVLDGTLGIIGSPYNPKATPFISDTVQEKQRTPKGTPSEGRPKGKPAKTPEPPSGEGDEEETKAAASLEKHLGPIVDQLTVEELSNMVGYLRSHLINRLYRPEGE